MTARSVISLAIAATVALMAGTFGIIYVYFRQSALPPSFVQLQLWATGITGEERYSGLDEAMILSSSIYIASAAIFSIGVILVVIYILLHRNAQRSNGVA